MNGKWATSEVPGDMFIAMTFFPMSSDDGDAMFSFDRDSHKSHMERCGCRISISSVFGVLLVLLIALPGFIVFWVGLSHYRNAKSKYPDVSLPSHTGAIFAIHWVFVILIAVGGVSLILHGLDICPIRTFFGCCDSFVAILGCLVLAVFFYIIYLVVFFVSAEFKASSKTFSLDKYPQFTDDMRAARPQVLFSGNAKGSNEYCSTGQITMTATSAEDASTFPDVASYLELSDVVVVRSTVSVEWTPEAKSAIENTKRAIISCFKRASAFSVEVTTRDSIDGLVEAVLISKTGEVPARLSRSRAIVEGIFWSGSLYVFDVCAQPSLKASIIKKNATPSGWTVDCASVYWSCHTESDSSPGPGTGR
jgi:hypothetical protein